jgi:hypothetical protein
MIWLLAAGLALSLAASPMTTPAAGAAAAKKRVAKKKLPALKRARTARPLAKRRAARRRAAWRRSPYGFLPGYRPPEIIARERAWRGRYGDGPFYALPIARFYRGRWNGGGFGPCYTYTPIGPIWNCGQ